MSHRSGLGFSTVEALSPSGQTWKEKIGRIMIFLCLLILIGLLFTYVSGATHTIGSQGTSSDSGGVSWDSICM